MIERPAFSAAEIAAALAQSKWGVHCALDGICCARQEIRAGGQTKLWRVDQLPELLRDKLASEARRRGFLDSEHLLRKPDEPWQPTIGGVPVKLSDIAEKHVEQAQRRQRALLPSLVRDCGDAPAPVPTRTKRPWPNGGPLSAAMHRKASGGAGLGS